MGKPFDSVLIANRGEIAVRIIRACRQAKLRSIAIYSDADTNALHVRDADEAHRVGPPPPSDSYLNTQAILDIARQARAQALHPGYGFLSENADFADLCLAAELVWIGPSPDAMRLLGDKAAAKALAERVGVPILPGYHGPAQDDDALLAAAERIGLPLLVKAVAGGGGRGMRIVRHRDELPDALAAARREAKAGFGDDRLLLERYLERPRHVEMQLFGDEHGNVLYLGERDCSIQRRHQKVIEEAPASNFSPEQRTAMGEAAVALARAAGYTNAGTAEFLLDGNGRFYFLEVNARLQVEHPVTEMVTGLDLVRLQFTVAAGERLEFVQDDLKLNGHAIECRLYAEDPATEFLPSSGRITRLWLPAGADYEDDDDEGEEDIRVDSGTMVNDLVSSYYDPLLAKIIVRAVNRAAAIELMASMLSHLELEGIRTNLRFLQAVIATPAFAEARLHTGFIHEQGLSRGPGLPPIEVLMAIAASEILNLGSVAVRTWRDPTSPSHLWRSFGPWRSAWTGVQLSYRLDETLIQIGVQPPIAPHEPWVFRLPEGDVAVRVRKDVRAEIHLTWSGRSEHVRVSAHERFRWVDRGRYHFKLELVSGLGDSGDLAAHQGVLAHDLIRSPMPGRVVQILVKPGDDVKANQTLLVLEAMKIEHLVTAPRDGIVKAIRCREGDQVELGAELVELEDRA